MKKGQWVEFQGKTGITKGIVISGGAQLTVGHSHKGNTYKQVKAPARYFKPTDAPNLDISGIMDAYSLKGYKSAGGDETERFEASLYVNGKRMAIISNNGCGGCNDIRPTKYTQAEKDAIEKFYEDAKKWAINYGERKPFEPEALWVEWFQYARPIGQSAKCYWDDVNK